MKTRKDFIPADFPARVLWCTNLAWKLSSMKAKYNLSDEQIKRLDDGTKALGAANEFIEKHRAMGLAWTQYRNKLWQSHEVATISAPFDRSFSQPVGDAEADFEDFLRGLVHYIRSQPAYSDADGKALGFFGPHIVVDVDAAKPVPRLTLAGGRVRIRYAKHMTFTGVMAWADHGDGEMLLLGVFTHTTFDDLTPLPDAPTRWVYRLQYRIGDALAGQPSETAEIVVSRGIAEGVAGH